MPEPLLSIPDRAALLADLRARIRRIEGVGGEGARTLSFGVEAIDAALPDGGLPLGCLHALTEEGEGAGTAFAAALLARLATARAPALWLLPGRDLHAAGLAAYGLTPDRLIAVRAVRRNDALWAMEEALRCSTLSAVLGEVDRVDLTASRRLQLAAESSGVTGFLLRRERTAGGQGRDAGGRDAESGAGSGGVAVTRWRLAAAPSRPEEELGVGAPRWRVDLERCRGGRPGSWILEWADEDWREDRREETPVAPPSGRPRAGRLERVA